MSMFNCCLKLTYSDNFGGYNPILKFIYNDDGTATLTNPKCENRYVVFDKSVVKYLKIIEKDINSSGYYFVEPIEKTWNIKRLPNPYEHTADFIDFVSGDMIDDGTTIICTNPITSPSHTVP